MTLRLLKLTLGSITAGIFAFGTILALAGSHSPRVYGPFPVTVKGYSGDKTNSVSYSGQIARHLLHNGLKKSIASGASLEHSMTYFKGSKDPIKVLDPVSSGKFVIDQAGYFADINTVSSGKNLNGKSYKGLISGWPGGMTGVEVLEFMIEKGANSPKGYDSVNGYDYSQLVSKFAMGAVFYNQACDNYLDEKLASDNKPNNKPYKKGAYYSGKEHSWDEAFGYWGAAAHTMALSAKESYEIAKKKNMSAADFDKSGKVDRIKEMTYAHAYYASSYDKGGKTNYLKTVTKAFIDGRKLIASADSNTLTDAQRNMLIGYANTICGNWEKVIAESVFKYAGSVYKDLEKLAVIMEANGQTGKAFRTYVKHWGELKGFALALEAGKRNLGATSVKLNRMMGYGPWLMNTSQVVDIDSSGEYVKDEASSMQEYMLHMLKIQKLMVDQFGVAARNNDQLSQISDLSAKLGGSNSSEND